MDVRCYSEGVSPFDTTWGDLRRELVEAGEMTDQDIVTAYTTLRDGGFIVIGGGAAPVVKVRRVS